MELRNTISIVTVLVVHLFLFAKCDKAKKPPLQCYVCDNDVSFEDCTYYQSNDSCVGHEDRCIKAMWEIATVGSITTGFIKGCTTKDKCNTSSYDICRDNDGYVTCEVMCCKGNLCNGSGKITSGIMTTLMMLVFHIWNTYKTVQ